MILKYDIRFCGYSFLNSKMWIFLWTLFNDPWLWKHARVSFIILDFTHNCLQLSSIRTIYHLSDSLKVLGLNKWKIWIMAKGSTFHSMWNWPHVPKHQLVSSTSVHSNKTVSELLIVLFKISKNYKRKCLWFERVADK